jgi:hypothetical protein
MGSKRKNGTSKIKKQKKKQHREDKQKEEEDKGKVGAEHLKAIVTPNVRRSVCHVTKIE